jgi:PilZ domain-containing protein
MDEIAFDNRRQNYRLARKPEHPWQLSVDDALITKNIVDLSATGLAFKAPASFNMKPGQTLHLNISLKPGENFECQGRILWSRSDSPSAKTMKLFGVQFEKLPAKIDAMIIQELYKETLKIRWSQPKDEEFSKHFLYQPPEIPREWLPYFRQFVTIILIAAFFMAARIYERTHPQDSIEYRFNQGLAKKLNHF